MVDGLNVSIGGGATQGRTTKSQQSENLLKLLGFARESYRSLNRVVVVHRAKDLSRYRDRVQLKNFDLTFGSKNDLRSHYYSKTCLKYQGF